MRNSFVFVGMALLSLTAFLSDTAVSQTSKACTIEIQIPKKGDKVGASGLIRGFASVPVGMKLWVFVHKEGWNIWWPQGGGAVPVKDGKWVVAATYGNQNDTDSNFEITAVVVSQDASAELDSYVKKSAKENQYPGTDLPQPPDGGCALKENVIVQRK